ncbi:unnamed protein product, partial [Brenthis ino]
MDDTADKGGKVNLAFESSEPSLQKPHKSQIEPNNEKQKNGHLETGNERVQWGSQLEFLMSCIALSVGLGNVWRFPFIAYKNGGGAFLIPYIIVLIFIGKPMYYLECSLGQFSSRNVISLWALAPAMKGVGYAQIVGNCYILSYFVSIIALCIYYLAMSFQSTLPWAVCDPEWRDCVPSGQTENIVLTENSTSSAELYFTKSVLQLSHGLEDGLGMPVWYLALCLLSAWLLVFLIISRGIQSSGKAAYFLALFPYIVMIILLISTLLLPGSGNGILFFLTPQWDRLIDLRVWYNAVTQVFFSLSVCSGPLIMFSSYNNFRQNVYRDAMIVTTLDTFTSLLSGITIFGILGNLAYVLDKEVGEVVGTGGTGLAFVSYPDAIAKTFQPQLFSVLFFLMMVVLGLGTVVALVTAVNTILLDSFPNVKTIYMSVITCTLGFGAGLIYVTPSGQYIFELTDYFGGTFLILFCGIFEIVGIFGLYGVENICLDLEFMLGRTTSVYWRFCWGIITPALMIVVFIYALAVPEPLIFGADYEYPTAAYIAGYLMLLSGVIFVPIFWIKTLYKNRSVGNCGDIIKKSVHKKPSWGPMAAGTHSEWLLFKQDAKVERLKMKTSRMKHVWMVLTGGYRRRI